MCRLVSPKAEVAISVDAALSSTRAYLERSARELHARGPASTAAAQAQALEGELPLEVQLEVLRAWHSWLLGALHHFKVQ